MYSSKGHCLYEYIGSCEDLIVKANLRDTCKKKNRKYGIDREFSIVHTLQATLMPFLSLKTSSFRHGFTDHMRPLSYPKIDHMFESSNMSGQTF